MNDICNSLKNVNISEPFEDPDTSIINNICKNIIGSEIKIEYNITFQNGDIDNGIIDNCNIVGDCLENILFPYIKKTIKTLEEGPKQSFPDFWNRNRRYNWELKTFNINHGPSFDISNFISYISQLLDDNGVDNKLFKTKYLIFEYSFDNYIIKINKFKLCNVWEIINYDGKYPISLQNKKNTWYNIRPCKFSNMISKGKTPNLFIEKICEAILICPNKLEDRENKIINIKKQFNQLKND
mgnify:CR=1 FL=1|tara:strand:- start:3445 stop:4164 length:720 start_codon:yes stop_codon:yes gene_type:complete